VIAEGRGESIIGEGGVMSSRSGFIGFWAGLVLGLAAAALSGGYVATRAVAQQAEQAQSSVPRYQISSWSYPTGPGGPASNGAYIIDTQQGRVWSVEESRRPESLGTVGEK